MDENIVKCFVMLLQWYKLARLKTEHTKASLEDMDEHGRR